MKQPLTTHPFVALLALVAAAALLYGHTLQAPFYLDDFGAIVNNPALRDGAAAWGALWGRRGLAILSFAANYALAGLALPGLHLGNIFLHGGCALLVILLLRRVFVARPQLALWGGLLFLAHPLQTQAVTYLVQRMTLLATLLALAALLLHLRSREARAAGHNWRSRAVLLPYGGAVLCGALSLSAKEITLPLPLLILVFERSFLPPQPWREQWRSLAPYCVAPLLLVVFALLVPLAGTATLGGLAHTGALASLQGNTPLHYLFTEFSVLWIYLRLLVLPYGQAFEYGYPVVQDLFNLQSLAALAGLLLLGACAWRGRRRAPRLAFAVAWFFLALAVESSILPLDPLFEHRLYLPSFAFIVAVLDLVERWSPPRLLPAVPLVLLLVWGGLTWQRNALWNDREALYADNLRRVTQVERVYYNLAMTYIGLERDEKAEPLLRRVLELNPRLLEAYSRLAEIANRSGDPVALAAGVQTIEQGLRLFPGEAGLLADRAGLLIRGGDYPAALVDLQQALARYPGDRALHLDLGAAYAGLGRWREAEAEARIAVAGKPDDPVAHVNLAAALASQGRRGEALASYRRAVDLAPRQPQILAAACRGAYENGDTPWGDELLARLRTVAPRLAREFDRP